jgi:hypothetical protein
MQHVSRVLLGAVKAAVILAVPAVAVCVFASSNASEAVVIQPGDDPVASRLATFKKAPATPAAPQARRTKVGQTPAAVEAQEWVATGGGGGGGGSPKG